MAAAATGISFQYFVTEDIGKNPAYFPKEYAERGNFSDSQVEEFRKDIPEVTAKVRDQALNDPQIKGKCLSTTREKLAQMVMNSPVLHQAIHEMNESYKDYEQALIDTVIHEMLPKEIYEVREEITDDRCHRKVSHIYHKVTKKLLRSGAYVQPIDSDGDYSYHEVESDLKAKRAKFYRSIVRVEGAKAGIELKSESKSRCIIF